MHRCADAFFRLDPYRATMRFDNTFTDRKAEPSALTASGTFETLEKFESMLPVRLIYPNPIILNGNTPIRGPLG